MNKNNAYDDSDSILRTSLRGFFTGKSQEYSTLVSNNDTAFSGNPIKALKHHRKIMFSNGGTSDTLEAKGIEELINDFDSNADKFKKSVQSIDFAQKLKQNQQNNKLKD